MNKNIFEEPSKVNCTNCKYLNKDRKYEGQYLHLQTDTYKGLCTLGKLYIFNPETRCTGFREI